jgi:rSAM/selenodomain-associated transferase 1
LIPKLGARNAAALAHAFNLDALAKARQTGLRVSIAASASSDLRDNSYFRTLARRFNASLIDQGTGSLGMRMRRALEPFCLSGALLIGTDTPSLPLHLLIRNIELMNGHRVVLGPSLDGGYYSLGIRQNLPDLFRGIRWGGARVLADSIARLQRARTRFVLAPAWYDIDRWSDLMLLVEHLRRIRASGANPCPATVEFLQKLGLL